jgi:ketosteroid isomerase-like protein
MSEENTEVVRRFYECWTNQDLDGVLEYVDADLELDWSSSRSPLCAIYEGHDGLMQFWAEQEDAWEDFSLELAEVVPCDAERLVAVTVVRGRGKGSGLRLEAGGATLWRVRGGKIVAGKLFQSKDDALEAVGPVS